VPIVHAGTLQVLVGDLETQRMDQMQPRLRDRAHASDIAGVLRDLRLKQHHVKHLRWLEGFIRFTASNFPLEIRPSHCLA
jgi:hypothetical protein